MKKPSYREMLRDRCPKVINYALKWQKAKERWIDHAYRYFVKLYGDEFDKKGNIVRTMSQNKRHVINMLLGIKKGKPRNFDFNKSIDWDNLETDEEVAYWRRISSWVLWFSSTYPYIENTYSISKEIGRDEQSIKIEIINKHLSALMPSQDASEEEKLAKYSYVDKFVDFLIRCLENKE